MMPEELHFKWDPHAKNGKTDKSQKKNKQEMKCLEDYFDFIEQFSLSGKENKTDEHVDKKFTL